MKPELLDPGRLLGDSTPLTAEASVIHVWYFSTEPAPGVVRQCLDSLSAEETERAGRFVFEYHRTRFTTAHGVLRHLLSRYCGTRPPELEFITRSEGKPALRGTGARSQVSFNLAHSGNRAVVAIARERALGIDLEEIRSMSDLMQIARQSFQGREHAALEALEPDHRPATFFRLWVSKEAVLKAQGVGLGYPLDRFQVPLKCDFEPAPIVTLDPERLDPNWNVRQIEAGDGWAAAVCAAGADWIVEAPAVRDASSEE